MKYTFYVLMRFFCFCKIFLFTCTKKCKIIKKNETPLVFSILACVVVSFDGEHIYKHSVCGQAVNLGRGQGYCLCQSWLPRFTNVNCRNTRCGQAVFQGKKRIALAELHAVGETRVGRTNSTDLERRGWVLYVKDRKAAGS